MTDRELLQQALAELAHCRVFVTTREKIKHPEGTELYDKVLKALRTRLAQPEQEPVGRFAKFADGVWKEVTNGSAGQPLYTASPQRKDDCVWCGCGDQIMPDDDEAMCGTCIAFGKNVPPRREWQRLTDEEMFAALVQADPLTKRLAPGFEYFARAIEAKLKEKNT